MHIQVDKLKTFLKVSGAEILEPTNAYEIIRFRTINGVSVIYQGKRGYSFTGEAKEAFEKMQSKSLWIIESGGLKEKRKTLEAIIERDGPQCFFCGYNTTDETRTIEHLLAVAHGGNNNHANLVIACQPCNVAVGNMPIIEKVRYRETVGGSK